MYVKVSERGQPCQISSLIFVGCVNVVPSFIFMLFLYIFVIAVVMDCDFFGLVKCYVAVVFLLLQKPFHNLKKGNVFLNYILFSNNTFTVKANQCKIALP
jgi:hypothetical protein